jgi:hypothetical protein
MRFINVSNFSTLRLKNCFTNDVIIKVTNGLIRNGHEVINYSDRDMLRFLSPNKFLKSIGHKNLQKHFIDFCVRSKPDAILLCHADTITADTLKKVRELLPTVKILQYNLDIIRPGSKEPDANILKLKSKLDVVDATLITTGEKQLLDQFRTAKCYVGFLPNPVDKSLESAHSYENEKTEYDLMFGATASSREFCGKMTPCVDVIKMVEEGVEGLNVKVFGLNKQNKIEGPDYQNLHAQCAMGFNFSRINDCYLYSSDRMAHIMGNGLLCVMQEQSGFKDIFNDDEVCFYKDEKELLEKLAFYKNNPAERMRVAKNGHDKYVKLFNEQLTAKYICDVLFGEINKDDYVWANLVK